MLEAGEELPEGLRDVRAALQLALDDQAEGGALHAAHGEEVGAEAAGREGDRAGQRRAPEQVDVLPRGARVGEREGEPVELGEGALDLLLGQRGVTGALHLQAALLDVVRRAQRGIRLDDLLQRLEPDQLALAVEVGRDHQLVRVLGDLLDRAHHVLVGRLLDQGSVDQLVQVGLLPVRVALREGRVQHVALEPDRHVVTGRVGPGVERHLVALVGAGAAAEDLGDLLGAVVLLGDDQSHPGSFR